MKSILQEESSVLKAIEKAWNNANRPLEFSIKILDEGNKNFLGISKRPAIISISYNSNQKIKNKLKRETKKPARKVKQQETVPAAATKTPSRKQKKEAYVPWKKEFCKDIETWLKELLRKMNIKSTFSIRQNKKFLNVRIEKSLVSDREEEKMIFISLSNLLMQFLKRKYKKKFANHYLIINNKNEGKK